MFPFLARLFCTQFSRMLLFKWSMVITRKSSCVKISYAVHHMHKRCVNDTTIQLLLPNYQFWHLQLQFCYFILIFSQVIYVILLRNRCQHRNKCDLISYISNIHTIWRQHLTNAQNCKMFNSSLKKLCEELRLID